MRGHTDHSGEPRPTPVGRHGDVRRDGEHTSGPPPAPDDLWSFRDRDWVEGPSLLGHEVWATDRRLGRVDGVVLEPGRARLEVARSAWTAGSRVVVPAGVVSVVDHHARMVMVNLASCRVEELSDGARPTAGVRSFRRTVEARARRSVEGHVVPGVAS